MPPSNGSCMTLRTYRITRSGEQVELSRRTVDLPSPGVIEISSVWPDCRCSRCCAPPQLAGERLR
ncbi:hypothetical protein [Kitasatospora nipponensis]